MSRDLTNLFIDETFQYLTQVSGSELQDGLGNRITELDITASNSVSASHSVTADSSSFSNVSISASYSTLAETANTASYILGTNVNGPVADAVNAVSSSYALTASYALNAGTWDGQYTGDAGITGSLTFTGVSSTLDMGTGIAAQIKANNITGSWGQTNGTHTLQVDGNVSATTGFTGSLNGNADTATSASYALTASYALNAGAGDGFPYTGSADISGSLNVVGPITANNFGTISLTGDSPGINRNIIDSTGADFTVIRSDSGIEIDNRAGSGSVSVYTNGNMQFEPQGDLDFYTPTGNINLTGNRGIFTAQDTFKLISNTTTPYQGITLQAPNVRVNLSDTGSTSGTFALEASGFAANTPRLLLSLGTGSYGSNPTTAIMNFTGDDAFFGAQGNFYIKNIYNDTGSITVWSETNLELRGDNRVDIKGDYFSNPGIRIPINLRGKTFADSLQADTLGFSTVVTEIVYIDNNTRAFVETPLQIGGGGTITVTAGSTLKILEPFGSPVVSSSYATTASYALNAEDWDGILVGTAQITGSLNVLGNADFGGPGASQTFDGYQTTFNATARFNNTFTVDGAFLQEASLATNLLDGKTNFRNDVQITGSLNIAQTMNLASQDPLPAGAIGDLAVSGSNLFFYNGAWTQVI